MKKINLLEEYPVYTINIQKNSCKYQNTDEIIAALKTKIDAHKVATFISKFDNYEHTKSLNGKIDEGIMRAKNIMFCFGKAIPKKTILALRPRSIGVVEEQDQFCISYLQAPNEEMNKTIINWIKELEK